MFDLTGHVALVTGGNSGIGLGFARGLAKAGARIALWGRDQAKNETAAEEIAALGTEAHAFRCDVASEDDVTLATQAPSSALAGSTPASPTRATATRGRSSRRPSKSGTRWST